MKMVSKLLVTTRIPDVFPTFGRIEFPRVALTEFTQLVSNANLILEEMLLITIERLESSSARWHADTLEGPQRKTYRCSSDNHRCHRSTLWVLILEVGKI